MMQPDDGVESPTLEESSARVEAARQERMAVEREAARGRRQMVALIGSVLILILAAVITFGTLDRVSQNDALRRLEKQGAETHHSLKILTGVTSTAARKANSAELSQLLECVYLIDVAAQHNEAQPACAGPISK